MRRMREGLGPDASIRIDCGWAIRWDVAMAIRRVKAFDEYNLTWIEEPLGAWDPEGYARLRGETSTLIAYGEREWNVDGYERILQTGTVDVVGVDPGRAEGITGFKKVADRVEYYRRQANAHAWSSAIATAASLAISFSSPAGDTSGSRALSASSRVTTASSSGRAASSGTSMSSPTSQLFCAGGAPSTRSPMTTGTCSTT